MSKGLAEARRTHQWCGNEGANDHGGKQRSTCLSTAWTWPNNDTRSWTETSLIGNNLVANKKI